MNPERWQQIDKLLEAVLDHPRKERAAFLEAACAGDEILQEEVEALLAAHERQQGVLDSPALEVAARGIAAAREGWLTGRRLGPYQIVSFLGAGGMGEVYRARDTRLDRLAALKILPSEVAADPERLHRFVREAKAASALNHPNIATIYEIGESEGIHWIAMELVEGEMLEERIHGRSLPSPGAMWEPGSVRTNQVFARGTRSPTLASPGRGSRGEGARESLKTTEILDIGIQVAEALDRAHSKGIIHRDIKPANIMLTPEGQVKVLDFGLAKRTHRPAATTGTAASTESQTTPGLIMGTVHYMSPEQVLGQEVDQRTDLFSLGVVLYNMVTGRLPFSGASSTDTLYKILHGEPEAIARSSRDVPAELEQIVKKCLEKDRELRYQHASDLCADLKRLKRDTDSGKAAAEVSKPKPHRFVLLGTALFLIAITAITGFRFLRSRNGTSEAPMVPVPFTTYPGIQTRPSFSPDGNQVAFSWNGEKLDNYDIYIKQIGSESPRRLTTDPYPDSDPAWSPDRQFIAFKRYFEAGKTLVMLIPANGGRERQVAELRTLKTQTDAIGGRNLCWHPGGKWLAVACDQDSPDEPAAIFLLSTDTGERRRLTSPPKGVTGDAHPAFSPDGRTLVFIRVFTPGSTSEIYLLRLSAGLSSQGEPNQLTFTGQTNRDPAWTPDGKDIIYVFGSGGHHRSLWRIPASRSGKPKPLPFSGEGMAFDPALSLETHRLVYTVLSWDISIWRCQIPHGKEKSGPPSKFIASTQTSHLPQYSPDVKEIAYVSWDSGNAEIWIRDSDGSHPLQLTHLGGPVPDWPRWSPDGERIIFNMASGGKSNIFLISAQGGQPKQLTHAPDNETAPCFSRDGKWIYFGSDRSGVFQVWKIPAEVGEAMQVTRKGGSLPQESMDGKTLFYLNKLTGDYGELWKVPVDGGEESRVCDEIQEGNFDVKQQGIYYVSQEISDGIPFLFHDFASGKSRLITTIWRPVYYGLTVSPDEHWIAYTQEGEARRANLMLVENFR